LKTKPDGRFLSAPSTADKFPKIPLALRCERLQYTHTMNTNATKPKAFEKPPIFIPDMTPVETARRRQQAASQLLILIEASHEYFEADVCPRGYEAIFSGIREALRMAKR
jgi:hypothetical protein